MRYAVASRLKTNGVSSLVTYKYSFFAVVVFVRFRYGKMRFFLSLIISFVISYFVLNLFTLDFLIINVLCMVTFGS